MLAGIARAPRMTLAERDHLYRLAGNTPSRSDVRTDHVGPGMQRVLDRLDTLIANPVVPGEGVLRANAMVQRDGRALEGCA